MRRKDREVTAIPEIEKILKQCKVCHVAMIDEDKPYVVPLNFGYMMQEGLLTLYFHSAKAGRKIDIWKKNNQVCFEISIPGDLIDDLENPCQSGCLFASVIGNGRLMFVEESSEKCKALSLLMEQQTGRAVSFHEKQAEAVCIYKISTNDFSGKRRTL